MLPSPEQRGENRTARNQIWKKKFSGFGGNRFAENRC